MTKSFYFQLFLLLNFFTLISCDPKRDELPEPDPFPSLSIFKESFLAEAKARGYELDLSGLDMEYIDDKIRFANGNEYCGYGWINHPNSGRRTVLISKDVSCGFATLSDLDREQFIFHEIGHAFLNLQHDNSLLCDGEPVSLMHQNVHTYEYYDGDTERKKYYLDELFDRLAAEEECINYAKDFSLNPVFFSILDNNENWNFSNSQGSFTGERITNSTPPALIISSVPGKISQETGYWYSQIDNPNIPQDAKVTLRTKVYSQGLTGPGVAIGLRIYEAPISKTGAQTLESKVLTTENAPISGTLDGQILELFLPNFSRKSIFMIPFAVIMPGTEGEVRFEEFEIIVEE